MNIKSLYENISEIEKDLGYEPVKIDDDTKHHVMRQERLAKKYNKPMSASSAVVREIISDNAKAELKALKSENPPQDNTALLNDMEELARMRAEAAINSKKFESIMTRPEDPDLHKGINAVVGNDHIKKQFNNLPKFQERSKGYQGIGPFLTGLKDKI